MPAPTHAPIKLLAIDLDGTLLCSRKTITPLTLAAMRETLARGVHIVLATARPPRSVRSYYDALTLTTPTINYNGALIWNEITRTPILHTPLAAATAARVIVFARGRFPNILVSIEILDQWYTDHYSENPEYTTETARHFLPDFIGPIAEILTAPITKLMFLGDPAWIDTLSTDLPPLFAADISQTRSDPHLLQIMSPHITKARALQHVAATLGIAAQNVLAMGDAPNDIEMMQWAGLAVAPANAWPETQKVAHAIVPSNDHDGVAHALRKFILHC